MLPWLPHEEAVRFDKRVLQLRLLGKKNRLALNRVPLPEQRYSAFSLALQFSAGDG